MTPLPDGMPEDARTLPIRPEPPAPAESEEVALGEPAPALPTDPGTLVIRRPGAGGANETSAPDDQFAGSTPTEAHTLAIRPARARPGTTPVAASGQTRQPLPDPDAVPPEAITQIIRRGQAPVSATPPAPSAEVRPEPHEHRPRPTPGAPAAPAGKASGDPATVVVARTRTPAPAGGNPAEPEVNLATGTPTLVPGGPRRSTPTPPVPADALCPRCGSRLVDPGSLGLCGECGYCRLLEEGASPTAPPRPQPSALGLSEFLDLVAGLPLWVWVLLVGEALAVLVSVAAQLGLHEQVQHYTVWWYSVQAGAGLVALLVAQLWALMLVAPEDDRLGPKDLFLPVRLWWVAVRRLPATRWPVWIGTWGLTLLLGAAAVFLAGRLF